MQGEPPTHRGSLTRRLRQAGLGALCVTRRPRQVIPRRRVTLPGGLIPYVLGVLLPLLVFLITLERIPRNPLSPPRSAHASEQPGVLRLEYRLPTTIVTAENTEDLARIIMSEAAPGVANTVEAVSVGYTVRNRMHHLGSFRVRDVWDAYAHHAPPTDTSRSLAARVLEGTLADPSGGATHFYSPRSMPRQGDAVQGFDTGGGLEQTAGLPTQNYRPGWAALYDAIDVAGVRPSYYKFYRQPDQAMPH